MRFQILFFISILITAIIFSACGGSQPAVNVVNSANVNSSNIDSTANTNSLIPAAKTPEETVNKGETVAPVVKAYCDAMTRKDEAAIRKVYSAATLKSLEADMKDEKKTSLIQFLSETDQVSNKLCEVRNEKVESDTAIAEVRFESYPNGIKIKFVKENGEWKMTNESPTLAK